MKTFIDHKLLFKLSSRTDFWEKKVFFGWPSFLEYVGLEVFSSFPLFGKGHPLFDCFFSGMDLDKELVTRLYDQIFVECLTQVKAIEDLRPEFFLGKIKQKSLLFADELGRYEKLFQDYPSHAMHDLILYLAWDRVCVWIAVLFEHIPVGKDLILDTLKECLIESFQHITENGKTKPSFSRLVESLYAYQMREEKLPRYTEEEWSILCQSAPGLQSRERVIDSFFIDEGIKESLQFFTLEREEVIRARILLAKHMMQKLENEVPNWIYGFFSVKVACIEEVGESFSISTWITL